MPDITVSLSLPVTFAKRGQLDHLVENACLDVGVFLGFDYLDGNDGWRVILSHDGSAQLTDPSKGYALVTVSDLLLAFKRAIPHLSPAGLYDLIHYGPASLAPGNANTVLQLAVFGRIAFR